MIRKLKALGLALIAVFAMSAVAASAAKATAGTFSWPETTKHLTVEADPTSKIQTFKITAGKFGFTCNTVKGEAAVTGTSATSIAATGITFTDTSKAADTCIGPGNSNAAVKMNGCTFTFQAGTTLKEAPNGETEGTTDIVCPAGASIRIGAPLCEITIGPQTGLGPVYYRTVKTGAKEEITIEAKVGLDASKTHNKAIAYTHGDILCGFGGGTDGTYESKITVKAYGADKTTQTDVTVT